MEKFKGKRIKPNELIKKQRSIYITQDLQNMDTHPNKLKNRPQIQKQENTFEKPAILIV